MGGATGGKAERGVAGAIRRRSRWRRNGRLAGLGVRLGLGHAGTAARKIFAGAERKEKLSRDREIRSAEQIAGELGQMKGALMKLGQMASYLDDGLPEPLRAALATLQNDAPPMSAELVGRIVAEELGAPPEELFDEWDPEPIAAASIGQVHRALWTDPATSRQRAVAVKVQYPGVAEAIEADLRTADLLGAVLAFGFKSLDPAAMVEEIKERLIEELDYRREADNQRMFHEFYAGHPLISIPDVIGPLCTARVLTTELVSGHSWQEVLGWDQHQRDLAAETIFRFVFRSLYRFRAFNGDPHPGNYIFHAGGRVTFLDFGLVKHFSDEEMTVFMAMITAAVIDPDPARFRSIVEDAGLLVSGAPVDTDEAGRYFSHFYEPVRESREMTWDTGYATSIVRHTFDRTSPIAQYATVPRSFVFIQRINLGLYALLGHLGARGNYRAIAEELWPMTDGAPSTEIGRAEAQWLASRTTA